MASTFGTIGRIGVLVQPEFKGAQKAIRDGLGKPISQEAPKQGRDVGNMIVNGTTRAFQVGGLMAGAALGTAITKGFGRLRAMEDATAKIEGLGYAASEVDQIMGDVQGALDGTMFLYSEGANVAAGALAAGVEQGAELESYLRLTADAATQAGIDFNSMGQMMNRVNSSGKLTGDVLNQLEENGVYVGAAIAESLGVTQEEFRKMVSQGEVSADVFTQVMEEQFAGSSEKAAETMSGAMSLAWTAVGQLGERLISEVYPYLRDFFQGFYDWVQEISPAVEDFGKRVGEALGSIIGWLTENPGAVKAFAAAIGAVFAAMAAYTIVTKVTDAFKGLNLVMSLNPVGVWIAAITALVVGLIWAWNNVDWFRDAVTTAWEWISTAALWAWENVLKPVIDALVVAWQWVADVFTQVWENYLSPVFEGIGRVVTWLWENIISPAFGFIMGLFLSLGEVFQWVWEYALQPVFNAIGAVATWLWEWIIRPVFGFILAYWGTVFTGMAWSWEYILKPVFNVIAAVAVWLWETVLQPVFSWIGEHWGSILGIMKWWWDYVLKPVWDAIAAVATWLWESILSPIFTWIGDHWDDILRGMNLVWENVLKPAFEKIGETVLGLKDKFDTAVSNIKKVWDTLKGIAARPIKFVIDKVINDGLIRGFNALIGLIPFMDLEVDPVPVPSWMQGYARGGWTGPGSKYDPAGIVHADEFVINKASRRRFEHLHPGLLTHINSHGDLAGYASGGLVQPVRGPVTSGFGARWGSHHSGIDWAVPIGTAVRAALAGTVLRTGFGGVLPGRTGGGVYLGHDGDRQTYYGHLSRIMVQAGEQIAKGQIIALSGNTGNSTGPHLHFETHSGGKALNPAQYLSGATIPEGDGSGGGWDPLAPLRTLGEKIGGWFDEKFPLGGFMVDAAKQTATGTIDGVIDWLGGIIGFGSDSETDGGSGPAKDQVRDVAARYGWDSGEQWSALSQLIQRESSWNPNAANPSSSARGLFQKMTSIHGPVEGSAAGQAAWGLKYIKDRYHSPRTALDFHNRNNWYADGGLVKPDNYLFRDQGGSLPPGLSMVLNNTGGNEHIFNQSQLAALDRAVTGSSAGLTIHGDVLTQSPAQFADVIETKRRRAAALAPSF